MALWLPWFHRRISSVGSEQSVSGWSALGDLRGLMLLLVLGAVTGAVLGDRTPAALGLVLAGGLALMVTMAVTVDRVGAQRPLATTTTPAAGLALAYAGALAVILAGLLMLLRDTRKRSQEG